MTGFTPRHGLFLFYVLYLQILPLSLLQEFARLHTKLLLETFREVTRTAESKIQISYFPKAHLRDLSKTTSE